MLILLQEIQFTTIFSHFRISDLVNLHEDERLTLLKKSMKERKHMDKNQDTIEHYLDDVVIALNQRHANQEMEIKGEYNSIKEEVRNKVYMYRVANMD